jgi:hypothetical protein
MSTPNPQAGLVPAQPDLYTTDIGYPPADTGPLQVLHSRMLDPEPLPEPEPEAEVSDPEIELEPW